MMSGRDAPQHHINELRSLHILTGLFLTWQKWASASYAGPSVICSKVDIGLHCPQYPPRIH